MTEPFSATAMPDIAWWAELWPDPYAVLRAMGIAEGMTVIDLCCGDGYFTAPLAQIVQNRVYGVELDSSLLEKAQAKLEHDRDWSCEFIHGDARELTKLVSEKVDYVFLANTFHGVEDKTALMREVEKALRPDGRLGIVNWHRWPREETIILGKARGPKDDMRMTPEATQQAVEPAGFDMADVVGLPPYHYGAIFIKTAGMSE